jgi:predicted RNA methylase
MPFALKKITKKLITDPINYSDVRDAANELYHFFNSLSPTNNKIEKRDPHIQTDYGLAVSTESAAFCIIDFMRTRNFILAIKQAIEDKLTHHTNKPIIVLYAGTGPFASLIIPLTTVFSPDQVQFILLEINEASIVHLQKVIKKLEIQDYIINIIQADASTYCLAKEMEVDILVSETMKPALDKEPQISIISNLISQCKTDVTLIPESIKVDLAYLGKSEIEMFAYESICELINFDTSMAIQLKKNKNEIPVFAEGISVKINEQPDSTFSQLSLLTYIKLYKNIIMRYNESSLTIPFPIAKIESINFPVSYNIKYNIAKHPGFSFEKIID